MLTFNLSEWWEQMQKSVLEVFGGQEPLSAEGEQRMSIHPSDLWRSWMRSDGGENWTGCTPDISVMQCGQS